MFFHILPFFQRRALFNKDYSLHLKFFLATITSILIIFLDSQYDTFHRIRSQFHCMISKIYFITNYSYERFEDIKMILKNSHEIVRENQALKKALFINISNQLLLKYYKRENDVLKQLLGSPLRYNEKKILTKVISTDLSPYRSQILIDKGSQDGVYIGQPVINHQGIVGQVISTTSTSSRVLLICDVSHALPIQVLRNNIRMIITGSGYGKDFKIEYSPKDIKVGDIFVTSGVGGRFPEGYPVAVVSSIQIDIKHNRTIIYAKPTALLQNLYYLLLLYNNNYTDNPPLSPDEVHDLAKKRFMHIISNTN
ncbi:rod shape-determining protein MreC [Candidatus Schneideria nysicola]|uniref:rod shape-determining protein MreC n=1 Tax=Candidatus Schneideria nysicola TaxID=1081631 RepID=UPI001CAA4793|nr:rod shape-determining protein MreC [Candidatus Schneideria nysicola]UAJ66155.1 rod shape-determining protein MreC [Candidatus Schneideria nysicola]